MEMESARFFSLAMRVMAYDGVISKHIQYEQDQAQKRNPAKAIRTGQAKETPVTALGSDIVEVRH